MNLRKWLRLIIVFASVSGCAGLDSALDSIVGPRLTGTWYYNGKPEEIYETSRGLEARNDAGMTTRLEMDGNSAVRALDWGDLRGEIRSGRIDWANGTTWTRNR